MQESDDGVVELLGTKVVLLGAKVVVVDKMVVVVMLALQHSTEAGESQNPSSVLKTESGGQ